RPMRHLERYSRNTFREGGFYPCLPKHTSDAALAPEGLSTKSPALNCYFSECSTWNIPPESSLPGHHQPGNQGVGKSDFQQELPAESHQLVIAEARQRAANPDVKKQKREYPEKQPEDRQDHLHPVRTENRSLPSAQEQN